MNKNRRSKLREAKSLLGKAVSIVTDVRDDEQEAFDNLPEGLQESERFSKMEEAIDGLEDAISSIESASENIENAMGG